MLITGCDAYSEADPERVMRKIVEHYNVKREEIFRGVRGRENEARKVAMYLVKRCCDRTLPEIADYFGTNVLWNRKLEPPGRSVYSEGEEVQKIGLKRSQLVFWTTKRLLKRNRIAAIQR